MDEWVEKRIREEAERIRNKMLGGKILGIDITENAMKDIDILVVGAYYLGTSDNALEWKTYINERIGNGS